MKLIIGFLTYNEFSAKYLSQFLPSLQEALKFLAVSDYQVLAFDNSPLDQQDNHSIIRNWNQNLNSRSSSMPIKYLTRQQNLGFSRAYNILLKLAFQAQAEYFLMINPDILLNSEAIQELLTVLDQDHNLAVAVPKILRWDFEHNSQTKIIDSLGLVQGLGLQFSDWGQGQKDDPILYQKKIIGPSGAMALFRLSSLMKIQSRDRHQQEYYFDERFFMYKEDCDLAYRLFLAGLQTHLVPTALVYHDRTASSLGLNFWKRIRQRRRKSKELRSWSFHNQHLIFMKYWKKQNFLDRLLIIFYLLGMFLFSLILEQSNLKQYPQLWKELKQLTDIK